MSKGNWKGKAKILTDASKRLEKAGADFIVIATNTMHKLVPDIEKNIHIPILHIADTTLPVFDTTIIHATKAVEKAFDREKGRE